MAESTTGSAGILAQAHSVWLGNQHPHPDLLPEWESHDSFSANAAKNGWVQFDVPGPMIWRFTSTPSAELISIDDEVDVDTIIKVIGKHSGGNDKTNAKVRTSSWCRNLGALIGTACSTGGDKNVLFIINNADYLYGIDMTHLPQHGMTARPALHRLISLFETEYVIVSTPGNAPLTIDALASIKYANPFKGRINVKTGAVESSRVTLPITGALNSYYKQRPPITPETIVPTGAPDPGEVEKTLAFARKCALAATTQSGIVQMKEGDLDAKIMANAMREYVKGLK